MADSPPGPRGAPIPWRAGPEDLRWAAAAHFGGIFVLFLAPLVVLLVHGRTSGFVRTQAAEALNFQLTVLLGYIVSALLIIVVIGLVTMFAVWVTGVILAVVATVTVRGGEPYRYPVSLRLFA